MKQSNPELVAAWKIVQCMWKHDHAGVYAALRAYSWASDVQQVVAAVGGESPVSYSSSLWSLHEI